MTSVDKVCFTLRLLKTTFSQISIHGQLLVKNVYGDRTRKTTLLMRLKNIGMASEKLY